MSPCQLCSKPFTWPLEAKYCEQEFSYTAAGESETIGQDGSDVFVLCKFPELFVTKLSHLHGSQLPRDDF
jgi:hypothetical protein